MNENKQQTIFEKMGGTYTKVGDYYIPNLTRGTDAERADNRPIGKYGIVREAYLKEYRQVLYNYLLLSGKLPSHLRDVQEQAQDLLDRLIPQYKSKQGGTEQHKAS